MRNVEYNGRGTIPKPFKIKAFITCPAVIFSRLSTPDFWLITSTISISSIKHSTIPLFGQYFELFLILLKTFFDTQ